MLILSWCFEWLSPENHLLFLRTIPIDRQKISLRLLWMVPHIYHKDGCGWSHLHSLEVTLNENHLPSSHLSSSKHYGFKLKMQFSWLPVQIMQITWEIANIFLNKSFRNRVSTPQIPSGVCVYIFFGELVCWSLGHNCMAIVLYQVLDIKRYFLPVTVLGCFKQ